MTRNLPRLEAVYPRLHLLFNMNSLGGVLACIRQLGILPPRQSGRQRSIRCHLLVLFIATLLPVVIGLGILQAWLSYQKGFALLYQRGAMLLREIEAELKDQRRIREIYAQQFALQIELAGAMQEGQASLDRVLLPLRAWLGIDSVLVVSKDGDAKLRLGPATDHYAMDLLELALSGVTRSEVTTNQQGIVIAAASPIRDEKGMVAGAIIVSTVLNDSSLKLLSKDLESIDLAVFWRGRLVATTASRSMLRRTLENTAVDEARLQQLETALLRQGFWSVVSGFAPESYIVAILPMSELEPMIRQQILVIIGGSLLLAIIVIWAGQWLVKYIALPLENIVAVTAQIAKGNYEARVPVFSLQELNELGRAINDLAGQLGTQLLELERQAFHDPLTGLPNRYVLMERIEHALAHTARRNKLVALMFLDLDSFKVINDTMGHDIGDLVLQAVARRLQGCVRPHDTVARLGGDEFVILLEDINSVEDVISTAKRVHRHLGTPIEIRGQEFYISASIGITLGTRENSTAEVMLRQADIAMYRAKTNAIGYAIFDLDMHNLLMQRLNLEADIRRALEHREFRLYYQPVVQLETGRIIEVEALVRWEHPQRGLLYPSDFLSLAEETGLILSIGLLVLRESCQQVRRWQQEYPRDLPLTVSVNLSARQLQNPMLVQDIERVLQETQLDPASLKLEIAERTMLIERQDMDETLNQLRAKGVRLALDDFGAAYFPFAYLKQFPFDSLKIDRSLISGLGIDPKNTAIVRAILTLAKTLNLDAVAEGIETLEQLIHLRDLGCELGQGYYLAHPDTSEAISALLGQASGLQLYHPARAGAPEGLNRFRSHNANHLSQPN